MQRPSNTLPTTCFSFLSTMKMRTHKNKFLRGKLTANRWEFKKEKNVTVSDAML